jgi:hypothetical protein
LSTLALVACGGSPTKAGEWGAVTTTGRASIPLVHIRQEQNLCVPTSAAMVLAYDGDPHPPRELKAWSRGEEYDPAARFDDFTITFFAPLVKDMRRRGYTWSIRGYDDDDAGFQAGLADIHASLDQGRPVLVDTTLFGGHTLPVTGYDDARGELTLVDPNIAAPGIRHVPYAEFARIWSSTGAGSRRRAAIFTTKPPAK